MKYDLPEELRVEAVGSIRVVTLNRPEALNSINPVLNEALKNVWGQIAQDEEARAVVLTGAGRAFCSGGDLENFLRHQEDVEHRRRSVRGARRLADEIIAFPLPVVAAVNGLAIGLGCNLAVMSDIVLMADTAYMADTHVAVGLVAGDGGAAFWPLMTSLLKAKELVLLGDKVLPDDAVRLGLANRVVPADQLLEEALQVAQRLADLPPQAVQDTKRAFNLHLKNAANEVMDFALAAECESFGTEHVRLSVERIRSRGK